MKLSNESVASYDSDRSPRYPVEHLATFKVNKDTGIQEPSDGMKKLIKLGDSSGIWPQKMLISFESDWVIVMDYEDGSTIEGFPGTLIQQPTAFISDDPNEVFNNILVFIVGGSLSHTDMHIFQCTTVSALNLVADLQALSQGNVVNKQHEQFAMRPLKTQPAQNMLKDQFGLKEMNLIAANKHQIDVDVLNHCIVDIEKFVCRLHYTTAAGQELEMSKDDGEQNAYGEGLLHKRSQRPIEAEFLDILAKFKLAFNLITKLKDHISTPQTPIHHLFTSLELILEIGNEECDEKNLPEQVVSPLLYMETITFLNKTLNVREKDLWYSCGPSWNVPKEQWQERVPTYHPIFSDNWSPNMSQEVDDNISLMSLPMTLRNASDNESIITITPDSGLWLRKLEGKRAMIALVNFNRVGGNDKELTVYKGEYLEILNNSRKWWRARNSSSQVGYVPYTILSVHELESDSSDQSYTSANQKSTSEKSIQANEIHRKAMEKRSTSVLSQPPPPPPMPPSEPATPYATLKKSDAILVAAEVNGKKDTLRKSERFTPDNRNMTQDELTNELQLIFALRKNRDDINIKQLPDVYIDERSSAKDVADWLRQKEFSENVVKKLDGVCGRDLFDIQLSTLIEYFGAKTGRRLDGMIIIQKKHCKFQTAGKSELKAILARARQKTGERNDGYNDGGIDGDANEVF